MPKSGKGKGRKAGGSQHQLGTPGLSNASPKHKTPEPTQLLTPADTPVARKKEALMFSEDLRTLTEKMRELEAMKEEEGSVELVLEEGMETDEDQARRAAMDLDVQMRTSLWWSWGCWGKDLKKRMAQLEAEKEELRKTILELEGNLEFWKKRYRGAEEFGFEAESQRDKIWEEKKKKVVGELEVAMKKKQRKKKEGAKDRKALEDIPPAKIEEDMVMLDVKPEQKVEVQEEGRERWKDVAPVTPPVTKKQATAMVSELPAWAPHPRLDPALILAVQSAVNSITVSHCQAPTSGEIFDNPDTAFVRLQDYAFVMGFAVVKTAGSITMGRVRYACIHHGQRRNYWDLQDIQLHNPDQELDGRPLRQ
ncbi:hypothetical protein BGX38DRAFT_1334762 [Terfezia claveryi]|nr:hypothetical protein BGX38DRAFT_1334762 [Terfezia claveryi]